MTQPTLRILSLGAGVQSTTLALMACEGSLGDLDGAICRVICSTCSRTATKTAAPLTAASAANRYE